MIHIQENGEEVLSFKNGSKALVWDVATTIKRIICIPRRQQMLYYKGKLLPLKSPLPLEDNNLILTLVRKPSQDAHENRHNRSGYRDTRGTKRTCENLPNQCRHKYQKRLPGCIRDNGEFDLVCSECKHVA